MKSALDYMNVRSINRNSMLVVFKDYLDMTRNMVYVIKIQTLNWSLFLSYAIQVFIISILSLFRFDYPHWLYRNSTVYLYYVSKFILWISGVKCCIY